MQQVSTIVHAFQSSQIQYDDKFLLLFSAYNAWYRSVTGENSDARALHAIKLRDGLWSEYLQGACLESLRPSIRKIAILTRIRPLRSNFAWPGQLRGPDDWEGLIEYWYAVRCDLVHANAAVLSAYYPEYIKLAYESLFTFMTEVVLRLQLNVIAKHAEGDSVTLDSPRLDEVDLHPRRLFTQLRQDLLKKTGISLSKHFTS